MKTRHTREVVESVLIVALLLGVFVFIRPQITGMVAGEVNQTTLVINKVFNESGELNLSLEGNLTSLAVSGSYYGGNVEIYLDELLVYSSDDGGSNQITGNVIGSNETAKNVTDQTDLNFTNPDVNQTNSNITNISINESRTNSSNASIPLNTSIHNKSVSINLNESESNKTQISKNISSKKVLFENVCEDTCLLSGYSSNISLRIIIENATLSLSEISYTYELNDETEEVHEEIEYVPEEPTIEHDEKRDINFHGVVDEAYYRENGELKQIDTEIVPSDDPDYDYMNIKNHYKTYFYSTASGQNVKYQVDDAWITFESVSRMKIKDRNKGELVVKDIDFSRLKRTASKGKKPTGTKGKFSYPKVYSDNNKQIDVLYEIEPTQLLEEFILNKYQGFPDISQKVILHNTYFEKESDRINFYHENTDELLFSVPQPVMYEKNNKSNRNYGLHFEIEKLSDDEYIFTKVIDEDGREWLASSKRDYPVVIDLIIMYGSTYQFNSGGVDYNSADALDDSHFVVAYWDEGNNYYGTARVGTVSGNEITYGSENVFVYDPAYHISTAALNSTHFVVAYRYGDFGNAFLGSVSGNDITWEDNTDFNDNSTYYTTLSVFNSTSFVVTYDDYETGKAFAKVGTVANNQITFGSEYEFESDGISWSSSSTVLDSDSFIVSYVEDDNSNNDYGKTVIGTVSNGNQISFGSTYTFNSNKTRGISVENLNSTHFVIGYTDSSIDWLGKTKLGVVSNGDQITFTSTVKEDSASNRAIAAINSTHFINAYRNGNNNNGEVRVFSNENNQILNQSAKYNYADSAGDISTEFLNSTHFFVTYQESNSGYAVIGDYRKNKVPTISMTLSPTNVYTTDTVSCNATPSDVENDTLTVEYIWYNCTSGSCVYYSGGNNTGLSKDTNHVITTLSSSTTTVGESWNCTLRSFDGTIHSQPSTALRYVYGKINGTIKDASNNPINNADVVSVLTTNRSYLQNTTSNAQGEWSFDVTQAGNYSIYGFSPDNASTGADIQVFVEVDP